MFLNNSTLPEKIQANEPARGGSCIRGVPRACDHSPTSSNTWVETVSSTFVHLDYLRFTGWGGFDEIIACLADFHLVPSEYGSRFYKRGMEGLMHVKILFQPAIINMEEDMFQVEIPGEACQYLGYEGVYRVYLAMLNLKRHHASRVDIAFDYVPFTPYQLHESIKNRFYRSYSRSTKWIESVDSQGKPTATQYVGARTSERVVRCYDEHGFTRLELEVKGDYSDIVLYNLFKGDKSTFLSESIGIIRDYIDILEKPYDENGGNSLADYWREFIENQPRAMLRVKRKAVELDVRKSIKTFTRQYSKFIAALETVDADIISRSRCVGWKKLGSKPGKYASILAAVGIS